MVGAGGSRDAAAAGSPGRRLGGGEPGRLRHGPPDPRRRPPGRAGSAGTMRPYQVAGVWYRPAVQPGYDKTGLASWYGPRSHNRTTADGELFDADVASAAHTTLPLPSTVEVTNLDNGRRLRVRVNDRGPFTRGRIIDLSRRAAKDLGFYDKGMARVRVRYIGPGACPVAVRRRGHGRYAQAAFRTRPGGRPGCPHRADRQVLVTCAPARTAILRAVRRLSGAKGPF